MQSFQQSLSHSTIVSNAPSLVADSLAFPTIAVSESDSVASLPFNIEHSTTDAEQQAIIIEGTLPDPSFLQSLEDNAVLGEALDVSMTNERLEFAELELNADWIYGEPHLSF